ncbi:MAG: lipopolysaccharide biosynthesis protein [Gemmatimonadota bacterium]
MALSLRRNSLVSVAGSLVRFAVALLLAPLLIRLMGLEDYGIWMVLLSLVSLSALAEMGIGSAATVHLAASRTGGTPRQVIVGSSLALLTALGTAVAVAGVLAADRIALLVVGGRAEREDFAGAVAVLAIGLLPRLWQLWLTCYQAGLQRYDLQVKGETAFFLALNAGTVVLAWKSAGFVSLAWWHLGATVLAICLHLLLLRSAGERLAGARWSGREAAELVRLGSAHWLSSLGSILFGRVDRLIVSAALGLEAVGLYSAAMSVVTQINGFSALPIQPIVPAVSAAHARGDAVGLRRIFTRASRVNATVVYVLAGTIFWAAAPIASVVTPVRAGEVADLLQVLAAAYAAYSLFGAGYYTLLGLRDVTANAAGTLAGAALTLGLIWWLAPRYGLEAAAWANVGFSVVWVANLAAAKRIGLPLRGLAEIYLPVCVSLLVCYLWSRASWAGGFPDGSWFLGWGLCMLLAVWVGGEVVREGWLSVTGRLFPTLAPRRP